MSRALRRQQAGKKPGRQRGARRPLPRPGTAGRAQREASGRPPSAASLLRPRWATDIISELQKVTWPTKQELIGSTAVVIVVSLILVVYVGLVDFGLRQVISLLIRVVS